MIGFGKSKSNIWELPQVVKKKFKDGTKDSAGKGFWE
jgi:hypothetical protein